MRVVKDDIFAVGAIDWDRRLFDELIPLPDGTTYNSYVVKGSEKTVLLDTVEPVHANVLINNLIKAGVEKIDYIVAHHGEQDHSGSIVDMLLLYPAAKVVTNAKCKGLLIDHLGIDEDYFITIEDGEELSLGNKTLKFLFTPWVHWPETFCTFLKEDKILFSCDFFGAHLATSNVFVENNGDVYEAAKRYYAEIMQPFRKIIRNNLAIVEKLDCEMIAPSHGPVYDEPKFIIDAYKDWASEDVQNEVVLAYVSMHDSTRKMAEYLCDALIERGVKVMQFDLTTVDSGKLAISLVDAATVLIGTPTVLVGAHPAAANAAFLANAMRPKTKFVSVFGSFGWASKAVEQLTGMMSNIKAEVLEPVMVKGYPGDEDFARLDALAETIAQKHNEAGL